MIQAASRALVLLAAALGALMAGVPAIAGDPAPDALLRRISDEVIETLRNDKGLQAGDPSRVAALVEEKILPHFDSLRATQMAVGRAWRQATEEQRRRLAHEFRTLLVRTYSGALAGYRDQHIEFMPLRARADEDDVTVRSRIRQAGAEPVAVEYDLARSANGWKVYDVRIAGISLVATYRSAFAEEVRNHGIEGLIATLAAKNRQGTNLASQRM
jgi:phospholipid transport system substrate-binding protein